MSSPPSSASWISSLTCSGSSIQSQDSSTLTLLFQWLRFIFLSPCPQRALLSAVDILFLLILFSFAVHKLSERLRSRRRADSAIKPTIRNNRNRVKTNITFKFSVFLTALLAISYIVLCILSFVRRTASPWKFVEAIFRLIQGITQITILVIVAHEKRFQAVTHPMTIRLYWVASFFISVLFAISAIIRISSFHMNGDQDRDLKIDDVFSLVLLPISAIFLVFSIKGSTGIAVTEADESESKLEEPLLQETANVTAYASANVFSRAVWPIALRSSLPCTRRASGCRARPDCDLKGTSNEEKEEELESESGGELASFGLKPVFSSLQWWSSKGLRGAVRESTKIPLPSNRGKSAFTVSGKCF